MPVSANSCWVYALLPPSRSPDLAQGGPFPEKISIYAGFLLISEAPDSSDTDQIRTSTYPVTYPRERRCSLRRLALSQPEENNGFDVQLVANHSGQQAATDTRHRLQRHSDFGSSHPFTAGVVDIDGQ